MCGICGAYHVPTPLTEATLTTLTDRIAHRGPDDSGHYLNGAAALGFRRLAIIDLSPAGHQPMPNEDDTLWLAFNGEIYNYPALRADLLTHGHTFRSQTDSECLLHGYEQWGPHLPTHLRGMFAFALYDTRTRAFFLARDRFGIKPLYYYWDGTHFAFASEIKALTALPGLDLTPDPSALWDYLTYLYIPTPKTAYQYIRQVPPGHTLTLTPGADPILAPYWQLTHWGAPLTADILTAEFKTLPGWADAVEHIRAALTEAVHLHLIADVPVGSLLSGGLDSSAITMLAAQHLDQPIQTFSIGFDIREHDERPYAKIVSLAANSRHREQVVTQPDLDTALATMLRLYDQPFADASGLPTLAVSTLAAQHVKVALSGDGGDEVFGGYKWYRRWFELSRDPLPTALRQPVYDGLLLPILAALSPLPKVTGLIRTTDLDLRGKSGPDRYGALLSRIPPYQKPRLLPDLAAQFRGYDHFWYIRQHWRADLDPLSAMQHTDLHTYLPDDILPKVDRASMAVALELRPPLLDHVLVETVAALPPEFRFDKRVFRAAVASLLPTEILTRGKKGFSAPLLHWLPSATINGARLGGIALYAYHMLRQWQSHPTPERTP